MPMIPCPGCGLPRADDQIDVVPCPVCAVAPASEAASSHLLLAAEIPTDPTTGLPADVSQMEEHAARAGGQLRSRLAIAAAFLLGIAVGVGGLLAGQRVFPLGQPEFAARNAPAAETEPRSPFIPPIVVAPMPRERRALESVVNSPPEPEPERNQEPRVEPKPALDPPALARIEPIRLNQPDAAFTLPRLEGKDEHIVLRGKVRMLRVNGLGAGAILDASGLEAGSIYVCGTINGGSLLKLHCPDGVVEVPAAVGERSSVEIHAPGSSVRFVFPTTPDKSGSLINGGATVAITARTVDLRGDVTGAGTTVKVTLTRNGSLKAAAVRGTATIEYKTENPKDREPSASAATVAPTATFKKVD